MGSDGKIHFTDGTGADTVLNFSSGVKDYSKTLSCSLQADGETVGISCYVKITNNVLSITWSHNGYCGTGTGNNAKYFRTTALTYNLK